MLSRLPAIRTIAVLLAIAAWTIGAHLVLASGVPSRAATLYAWAPIAVTVVWLVRHTRWHILWIAVTLLATLALVLVVPASRTDASFVYQLQYLGMQGALAFLFGRTLVGRREPLVTHFARLVRGELPPPIERYTRSVTLAWTVFFIAMALVAIALYTMASREAWSAFVNLLTLPCVLAVFAIEYAVRRMRFPDMEHSSILDGARAFQRAFSSRKPPP